MQNPPIEHSAILLTFIKLPFVFKTFVLSIFEWLLKRGLTVSTKMALSHLLFQGDMLVSIVLQYKLRGDQVDRFTCMWLNLGFPLVAKLQLWRSPQGFVPQGREAVEQTEDSESLSSM